MCLPCSCSGHLRSPLSLSCQTLTSLQLVWRVSSRSIFDDPLQLVTGFTFCLDFASQRLLSNMHLERLCGGFSFYLHANFNNDCMRLKAFTADGPLSANTLITPPARQLSTVVQPRAGWIRTWLSVSCETHLYEIWSICSCVDASFHLGRGKR